MTDLVRVTDAFVAYPSPAGTVMALRGLDLEVAAGERLLVQGPNGSGKSTLLRLLTGERAATAGSVEVAGTDLTRLSGSARRRWRRSSVGLVDQHARRALLPEWRVVENVALQLRLAGLAAGPAAQKATETLERLGLAHLGDRSITTLSGGEAQRVAICAALAHDPALILADEPTGELDELAARQVYQLLAGAGRSHGAALILVSHDRRASEAVDRAVRIRDGRVAEQWTPGTDQGELQVLDGQGWLRLPAEVLGRPVTAGRRGSITLQARALPDGAVQLTPDPTLPSFDGRGSVVDQEAPRITAVTPVAVLPSVSHHPASARPILRMTDVGMVFGTSTVFSNFDLILHPGDHVVLRGPSGSGKSTLLGLSVGLLDPTHGTVRIAATDWSGVDRSGRARLRRDHAAMAPQSTILPDALTVRENLWFVAMLRRRPGDDVLRVAADLGLTGLLEQPVGLLSGGERQRVAVARCLVSGAALVVLDEPTSQQDERSAMMVAAAVRAVTERGGAVLAASHDPVFIASAGAIRDLQPLSPSPFPFPFRTTGGQPPR